MEFLAHRLRQIPPAYWLLLLLPLLLVLPPVPIDETRYLSVAWEMRQTDGWITLHLNGVPYFDKPPLLFWLLNLVWDVFGPSLWPSRALLAVCGMACVALCSRIERQLAPDADGTAGWLMLGLVFFVLYTGVVMFDVLLCLCVLLGFMAMVEYVQGRGWKALLLLFAASALGMLTKGPVMLLHLAGPMLLASWWSERRPRVSWRAVAAMLAAAVLGGVPVLLWAWAAVHRLGPADAQELLLHQTAGRVVESFAHHRPAWWYLPWVPVLLLPWPLLLRWQRVGAAMGAWRESQALRFALCATVPALLAFCAVSGKQMHYLLPILPGVALLLGAWLRQDAALIAPQRLWWLVAVVAGVFAWSVADPEPFGRTLLQHSEVIHMYALAAAPLIVATLLLWRRGDAGAVPQAARVALFLALATLPLLRLQVLSGLDVRAMAQRVEALQARGVPLARTSNEPGLLTFLGQLPAPLREATDPLAWCAQHPDGVLLVYQGRGRAPSDAIASARLVNGWAALLPSRLVVSRPRVVDRSATFAGD
jgi:4-amino-4-deoxy-L-arabinose transferase-like glycosyltransferase